MTDNKKPAPMAPTTFGEFLRALRTERGIGLVELARAANIDPALLSRIERGLRKPPHPVMIHHLLGPLGIEEESEEHKALYRLSGRRLMTKAELREALVEVNKGREPLPPDLSEPTSVVGCRSIAEMVGLVAEHAITARATVVVVVSEDEVRRFQIQDETGDKKW